MDKNRKDFKSPVGIRRGTAVKSTACLCFFQQLHLSTDLMQTSAPLAQVLYNIIVLLEKNITGIYRLAAGEKGTGYNHLSPCKFLVELGAPARHPYRKRRVRACFPFVNGAAQGRSLRGVGSHDSTQAGGL